MDELEYEGSNFLRLRLVLSVLSGRSVKINKIRWKDENPGLRESEASLIRLMDKITNGSKFQVSQTGTQLTFQPGTCYSLTDLAVQHVTCPQDKTTFCMKYVVHLRFFYKHS